MNDFLLEIYSEEIPAGFLGLMEKVALEDKILQGYNINSALEVYSTPTRFAVFIRGLVDFETLESKKIRGIKADVHGDVLERFLVKNSLQKSDLTQEDGFYYFTTPKRQIPMVQIMREFCLNLLEHLSKVFPKGLVAYPNARYWARPLKNICAVFAGKIVEFEFSGLKSANTVLWKCDTVPIKSISDYQEFLKSRRIELDGVVRKKQIYEAINAVGLECLNEYLTEEVANLCERVCPIIIELDEEFLGLPEALLVSTISKNQRYFLFKENGKISKKVLVISNIHTDEEAVKLHIGEGNLRVLRARLNDAKYFIETDLKTPLKEYLPRLKSIIFHHKLGSVYERLERVKTLAIRIAKLLGYANLSDVEAVAWLCKCDIATLTVSEFTELQGYIGSYYAKIQGYNADISNAIQEHYKPVGEGEAVPKDSLSIILALADKLEKITSLWAVGEKPSSSKDPFAIRRDVIGVLRIIMENDLGVDLSDLLQDADMLQFFQDRLRLILTKKYNLDPKATEAVLCGRFGFNQLAKIPHKISVIAGLDAEFTNLSKRVFNILKEVKFTDISYEPSLEVHKAETELDNTLQRIKGGFGTDIDRQIACLLEFRQPMANFFENVMVMCEDVGLQKNRLALLQNIRNLFLEVADFSKL